MPVPPGRILKEKKEAMRALEQKQPLALLPKDATPSSSQELIPVDGQQLQPQEALMESLKSFARQGDVKMVQTTLDQLKAHGMEPTVQEFNTLMDAHANSKDLEGTMRVFRHILNHNQLQVNTHSYGIMMKCLVAHRRITDAFRLYEDMKQRNITISQPIYTTLIKGCTMLGDYQRAWRLFEHMRNEVCRPDTLTFNHMIHVCAKTGHTERALQLYQDMVQDNNAGGGLYPLQTTYNALIHACAKRPDYYRQTFTLVSEMEEKGYRLDRIGYNYLLMACCQHGDIQRAKGLWSSMLQGPVKAPDGSVVDVQPNASSYFHLLECYSRVPALIDRVWQRTVWKEKMVKWDRERLEAKMGLDNVERIRQGLKPVDINEWILNDDYNSNQEVDTQPQLTEDHLNQVREYVLQGQSEDDRMATLKKEAQDVFRKVQSKSKSGELALSPGLLNAYMNVLGAFGMKKQLMAVYDRLYAESHLDRDHYSFAIATRWLFKPRLQFQAVEDKIDDAERTTEKSENKKDEDVGEEFEDAVSEAWRVFEDYEKFRHTHGYPPQWQDLETKYLRTKLQTKGITHEHRRVEYEILKNVILGLTTYDDLNRATYVLSLLMQRGHAKIADSAAISPDLYSPSLSAVSNSNTPKAPTRSHPRHGALEGTSNLSPEIDVDALEQDGKPTFALEDSLSRLTLESMKHKKSGSGLPAFGRSPVEFRYSDFFPLFNRATDLGMTTLRERIQQMLEQGRKRSRHEEQKALDRVQETQRQLRRRWHGKRQQ